MWGLRLNIPRFSLPQGNLRQRLRLLVLAGTGGFPSPVAGGEEEIERFGNSILAGEDSLDVPHEDTVQDGVDHHHAHAPGQGESVV